MTSPTLLKNEGGDRGKGESWLWRVVDREVMCGTTSKGLTDVGCKAVSAMTDFDLDPFVGLQEHTVVLESRHLYLYNHGFLIAT